MPSLHVPSRFSRIGRFFAESDHAAWGVIAIAIVSYAAICAAFLTR